MELPTITVKACPSCKSRSISKVKSKRCYRCRNCGDLFQIPILKKVNDSRKDLPIPKLLISYCKAMKEE